MDWLHTASATSPRRRREGRMSQSTFKRLSSNSSTSSDILVAGRPQPSHSHNAYPQSESSGKAPSSRHADIDPPSTASVTSGILQIRFAPAVARERFRGIIRTKPKPLSRASNSSALPSIKTEYDDEYDDDDSSEGPNHRGTYSKEYTQRHPEIDWIHRGQGRYLPAAEIKSNSPAHSPRPTRQTTDRTTGSVATSEQTMEKMTKALVEYFDDFRRKNNPLARENWSPTFKSQFNQILSLIKTTSRQQWPKAIDGIGDQGLREVTRKWCRAMERQFPMNGTSAWDADDNATRSRHSRHAKATAVPSIEHRRSTRLFDVPNSTTYEDEDEEADDTDDSQDPERTFRKDYVDAHPEEQFYHTGNGWYKRGSRSDEPEKRRDSNASHAVKSNTSEASRDLEANATIHGEDLYKYPGKIFHHKGNGWYRHGVAPNGRKGSIRINADGVAVSYQPNEENLVEDENEAELAFLDPDATVDKAFVLRHPGVEWVHRGQGRYKRKNSVFGNSGASAFTPARSSERRSSKADNSFTQDYAESHASGEHGLRRTSSRNFSATTSSNTKRVSKGLLEAQDHDSGTQLFDRDYVEAHPKETFHHRGQGRYARGPRPKPADEAEDERLYDSAHVNSHPNETFYHRGQGKWARGLPPPGSSNKVAVRGPGAAAAMEEATKTGEENAAGEKPPPISALLRRDEGPDLWPNLHWIYRGGGKWCRQTKEEAQRMANAGSAKKQPRTFAGKLRDGPEDQLKREARAAEAALKKREAPTKMMRRRRFGMASKVSSNSESQAPTPRPPLLPAEEDRLTEEDLPSLYKDDWSDEEFDEIDVAGGILRKTYSPLVGPEAFVKALTKHDPAVRSLDNLKQLAANTQLALKQLQDEYLELDVIVAQNPMAGKKERKPVKGGRQPLEHNAWEDRKEAMLYDYSFDPRRIGYQDPDAQRIVRDADGRELRRRRNRIDPHHTAVDYGDGAMTSKRTVKPVSRFDGVVIPPPRKRSRLTAATTSDPTADENGGLISTLLPTANDPTPSVSPARGGTPLSILAEDYKAPSRGRWKNHVPKRIRELRGESVASARSSDGGTLSPKPAGVRKGRPPGSKNLHKRKDAGIKKGPRKPKIPSSPDPSGNAFLPGSASTSVEPPDVEMEEYEEREEQRGANIIPAVIQSPLPDNLPAAAAPTEMMDVEDAVMEAPSLATTA